MADITAQIDIGGAEVSRPDDVVWPDADGYVCLYFITPGMFLHGTPAEFREFARQITAKVTLPERVFIASPNGDIEIKETAR